jgi:hypothetical protein
LRIAPVAAAEAALQVPSGTEINALDAATNVWIRVVPPPQAPFWIYAELVRDGLVSVDKAQVRTGPGLSHKAVSSLARGTPVTVRNRLGDWFRIAAPTGVVLWLSGEYAATPGAPAEISPGSVVPAGTNEPSVVLPTVATPYQLQQQTLAAGRIQGETVQLRGRLDWSSQWRRDYPVSFDLLDINPSDERQPVCQLVAGASTYEKQVGCDVGVTGTRWWLADDPLPVVIAGSIEILNEPPPP